MTRAQLAFSFALAAFAGSCGATLPEPAKLPTTGETFGGKNCLAVRNPTEPALTAWESDDRAQITALRHQGVVAVRYSVHGCNVELEVLPNCIGGGSYAFTPSPSTKQDYITDERSLFAELPLGGARLSAQLRAHKVLRTDYTLVGIASLPPGHAYEASELHGPDCARATHVIARFYIGGFAMAAGDEQSMRASASLFGADIEGRANSKMERLFADGTPSACKKAMEDGKEEPLCSVPLRLGLLALTPMEKALASANTGCAEGLHFEMGIGCVSDGVSATAPPDSKMRTPLQAPTETESFRQRLPDPAEQLPESFRAALAAVQRWIADGQNGGPNAAEQQDAARAVERYYTTNVNQDAAARYLVYAAYWCAATAQPDEASRWWKSTIAAFQKWKQKAPSEGGRNTAVGSREASLAAEAEFTLLDQEIRRTFDYEAGFHHFHGTSVEVVARYQADATYAKKLYDGLQRVIDAYSSPEWTTVAIARQGSLYDSLRTGLYNTRAPQLQVFDTATEEVLRKAENSDNADLQAKAEALREKVNGAWRDRRDQEIATADQIMLNRYGYTVVLAHRYNVSNAGVARAIRRLAFFADALGDAKMRQFMTNVQGLSYTDGMFQRLQGQ